MPQPPANQPLIITPGKTVISKYPTPNLADRILVRRIDARVVKNFVPPTPGEAFDGMDPNSKFEGFVFATAVPADQGGLTDYYYVNERANQDEYNFAVDYPYNDLAFPRITRTYVYLRSSYVELPVNSTQDPVYATHQLTDHQQLRIENDPVLDSLFVSVQRVFEILPGPVITTIKENEFQQLVNIETQQVADPSTVATPSATTEVASVERTGTAKLVVAKGDTDTVFGQEEYSIARNESLIPYVFQSIVPAVKFSQVVAGVAQPPVLAADQWEAREKQLTVYKKMVDTVSHTIAGIAKLIGYLLTRDQQVATVTETWSPGEQFITPRATLIDAEVQDWGTAGTYKKEVEVERVFPEAEFGITVADPIPPEFQDIAPVVSTEITTAGQATLAPLGLGEFRHVEKQTTDFIKRVSSTGHDISQLPRTLVDQETSEAFGFGGVMEVRRTLDSQPQVVDEGLLVLSSKVKNLPGGLTLKETTQVAGGDAHVEILDGGEGYSEPPDVIFSGGEAPGGAAATAIMANEGSLDDIPPGGEFDLTNLTTAGDENGVFFFLGQAYNQGTWSNPALNGSPISMEFTAGPQPDKYGFGIRYDTSDLQWLIGRSTSATGAPLQDAGVTTNDVEYFNGLTIIDLGVANSLVATAITIQRDSSAAGTTPKVNVLGSNDGENFTLILDQESFSDNSPDAWNTFSLGDSTAYRYWKIRRSNGTLDEPIFRIQEIELYGTLTVQPSKELTYSANGDANGVFYYLGQLAGGGVWTNPQTANEISITAPYDTLALGTFDSMVNRGPNNTYFQNRDHAEVWFDIGADRKLYIKSLSYRQRADYSSGCTHFSLQATNNTGDWSHGSFQFDVSGSPSEWTTVHLDGHDPGNVAYRYFRLIIPEGETMLSVGEIELYGTLLLPGGEEGTLQVVQVVVTDGGQYVSAPSVHFAGDGSGAAATAVIDVEGVVTAVNVTSRGTGYTAAPVITFEDGVGAGATGHAVLGYGIESIAVDAGGSGYVAAPPVIITADPSDILAGGAVAVAVLSTGVDEVIVDVRGSGYTSDPDVAFSGDATGTVVRGFGIDSVTLDTPGSAYLVPPTVAINGDGEGARCHAIFGAVIQTPVITNPGSGYTSDPTVVFDAGSASASVTRSFPVASVTVNDGGDLYSSAPAVLFEAPPVGTRAVGTAQIAVELGSISVLNPGSGYTTAAAGITGGGGSGATASVTLGFGVSSVAVGAGGSAYTTTAVQILGDGTGATAHAVLTAGVVTSIVVDTPGSGYTSASAVITGDGTGAVAGAVTLLSTGSIKSVTITAYGTGFTSRPAVAITGDGAGGAAQAVMASSGRITGITVTNPGSGYLTAPAITLSGGGGSGADLTVVLSTAGIIQGITITSSGSGYAVAPGITFTGGSGSGAAAICSLGGSDGTLSAIVVDDPGFGYTGSVTVEITGGGDGHVDATAHADLLTAGSVKSVTITDPGSSYTAAPTVTFSGGGGTGAHAYAVLTQGNGTISSIQVTHAGSKFTVAPTISFLETGTGGSGAAATATLEALGSVIAVILDDPGEYLTAPDITFDPDMGTIAIYVFDAGWPILYETHVDEITGIVVTVRKELVEAGTRYSGLGYEEIQALDKWRSVKLTSYVDLTTIPDPEVWSTWVDYRFPDKLLSIEGEWNVKSDSQEAGQNYDGTFQTVANSSSVSGGAAILVEHGYAGPCRAIITRTYMVGPPACYNLPEPLIIHPSSGSVIVTGSSAGSKLQTRPISPFTVPGQEPPPLNSESSVGTSTQIFQIGPVLTGSYFVTGADQEGGSLTVRLPISVPTQFNAGFEFVSEVKVTKMRFNIWVIEVTRLCVPDCPCATPAPPEVLDEMWFTA